MITPEEVEKMSIAEKYELGYFLGWYSQLEPLTIRAGIKAAWFDKENGLSFDLLRGSGERFAVLK
jgi:hypothetical protein